MYAVVDSPSRGWPLTSSAFDRQNINLLSVVPLLPSLKISTSTNLGRLINAWLTAPPVLPGCLPYRPVSRPTCYDFKTPYRLKPAIKQPGEAIFLTESLQVIPIVLPNSTRWPTSPSHQTLSLRSYPHYSRSNGILLAYSSSLGSRKPDSAVRFTLSWFPSLF